MTGYPNYNYDAFHAAEEKLRDLGYGLVHNPANNFGGDQSLKYAPYIEQAILDVMECQVVICLPGWRESQGARVEAHVASVLGKGVYEADTDWNFSYVPFDKYGSPGAYTLPLSPELLPNNTVTASIKRLISNLSGPYSDCVILPANITASKMPLTRPALAGEPATKEVFDFVGIADGSGYKFSMDSPAKLPLWLVPKALIEAAGRALQHGAKKYAPNNWRKGMDYSEVFSALQRHMLAWNEGEDIDPDSGLNHIDHAAACLGFLAEYAARPEYARFDNRLKRQKDPS
jgi:hypothetical protein